MAPRKPRQQSRTQALGEVLPSQTSSPALPAKKLSARLSGWFELHQRDLPWRVRSASTGDRDGYHALVAETMLQQTQVSRVVGYFGRFLSLFPTVAALAAADESAVLAAWSGLGYYRRARNLHAAAKMIVDRFGGTVPRNVEDLLTLPGVGRYTAGAISSIAFGNYAPIVDGNVMRVLLRLHNRPLPPTSKEAVTWAWREAERLVTAAASPPLLNEGLMELGATICLPQPARPECHRCPVRDLCAAHAAGTQNDIPPPKPSKQTPKIHAICLVLSRTDGAVLLVQRPQTGMWQNMWQVPTNESIRRIAKATCRSLEAELLGTAGPKGSHFRDCGRFEYQTTHRLFVVQVRACVVTQAESMAMTARAGKSARWVHPEHLGTVGLASLQQRVLTLAAAETVRKSPKAKRPRPR